MSKLWTSHRLPLEGQILCTRLLQVSVIWLSRGGCQPPTCSWQNVPSASHGSFSQSERSVFSQHIGYETLQTQRIQSWNAPRSIDKVTCGASGRSLYRPSISLWASTVEVNHQETMYFGCIISASRRNAIAQVRYDIVPSALGRMNFCLLPQIVGDIDMGKKVTFLSFTT